MKKLLIIILMLYFLLPITNGQLWTLRRLEATGGIGTTQFFGDVGGYSIEKNILGLKDFSFRQTRFNLNGHLRYRIAERVSARVNLIFGVLHATDNRGSNLNRGFASRTIFLEPSIIGEYYFIKNKGENNFLFLRGNDNILQSFFESLDLYFFAGFGGLAYNVKPNNLLSARATGTGGFTGVLPMGVGVSMIYSNNINFGIEFGTRFTNSDDLDGYTSIYSKRNDVYQFLNFTITYKIKTIKEGPSF